MKPANFPGRKNERRKRALARMQAPHNGMSHYEKSVHPYTILNRLIVADDVACSVRTKKDRTSRARFAS